MEGPGLVLDAKDKPKKKRSMREGKSLEKQLLYSQTNSTVSTNLKPDPSQTVKKTDRSKKSTSLGKFKTEHKIIKKNANLTSLKVDEKSSPQDMYSKGADARKSEKKGTGVYN